MARPRVYTIGFNAVTISAVQDLFSVAATTSMAFEVHWIQLGQVTQNTVGQARLRLRYLPATFTVGSGGAAATPKPINPDDAAATVTGRTNDTTQATTSGTAVDIPDVWNLLNGYLWMPPVDDRPVIKPSAAFVLSLDSVLSSLVCSGAMAFGELF